MIHGQQNIKNNSEMNMSNAYKGCTAKTHTILGNGDEKEECK
jgi:hypothetical protein